MDNTKHAQTAAPGRETSETGAGVSPGGQAAGYAPWSGHVPHDQRRTPVTTYRLQMGEQMTFADAQALIPYLSALGVTDLYLSPILTAAPGSTHGYDVVDHRRISEVMGGRRGLEALARGAHEAGMGVVVDIVPNHMAVPTPAWHNLPLWSVLREGPQSPFATWFDVSVDEPILMPVLGARIGQVLADEELVLEQAVVPGQEDEGEQWVLRYYDQAFPVAEGTEQLPMHVLVQRQHYRLAYWKVGDEEINYRRFFDVGTLAAIRVEDPEVFAGSHALLLELMDQGVIDALRVDHPDGLADPGGYLNQLAQATGGAWIAAEKILAPAESLPPAWNVAGTTGYDAAWRIDQLQVDGSGAGHLGALMQELTGEAPASYEHVVESAKREIITGSLASEVDRLARILSSLTSQDVRLRDHTFRDLRDCVIELLVAADQYRAYVVPGTPPSPETAAVLRSDAERARTRLEADQGQTLDLVVAILLGEPVGSEGLADSPERAEAVIRFQQVCGAVTAKGVEDTAFYRWTHLTSLTEVGGNPAGFDLSADEAHAWASRTQEVWPSTMVASTTHDTKRGEDVRARLDVLASYSQEWVDLVHRLRAATAQHRPVDLDGRTENLLWQTLWGTWAPDSGDPMDVERLSAYLIKASREQKTWTSWTAPDEARERALTDYAAHLLTDEDVAREMGAFAALTARAVRSTILASKAVGLTWLGVADVYQGSETTRTSLVDPDNRRPVDYTGASGLVPTLERLDAGQSPRSLDEDKLFLVSRLARLRAARPDTFVGPRSGYRAIPVTTSLAFAYARLLDGRPDVVVIARRLHRRLEQLGGWRQETVVLPEGTWQDVLSGACCQGGSQQLSEVIGDEPVAVLARIDQCEDPGALAAQRTAEQDADEAGGRS
ncbi:malto-oligosyltrehalose synthase [Actinomyces bowdenii]|uniref:Malto-oligosyltrehalose synthase n=1 Tax=Actinomyces bowdenii TaxID=131109 RepID=A0A853EFR6_9ACTO|nr:malto-oligosyltrehalose synthase [Actinomyces bowdenii]MBF0695841.1 malto-oligosyltrehalose synthase [Actinomyces bowdenii]NYS68014.1 malto-oligosyltrehalose synthase [Actinomyces bowdenii]